MLAVGEHRLNTRQGGMQLTQTLARPNRWEKRSEAEMAATSCSRSNVYSHASSVPPHIAEDAHRWAGPGASWPQPTHAAPSTDTCSIAVTPNEIANCSTSRPRVNVVWHKHSDLRIHDHEPVSQAHLERPLLPVVHMHVFDPIWFGKTKLGGFPKTGALRAVFWQQCVDDLRASLRNRGQELFIRTGMSAAAALRELATFVDVIRVFAYSEVCSEELAQEAQFEAALRELSGVHGCFVRCWGYTLHHIEDLKQGLRQPPEKLITPYMSFGTFKKVVSTCRVRPVAYEWQSKVHSSGFSMAPLPDTVAPMDWGHVPSLDDLGFSQEDAQLAKSPDPRAQFLWHGGESRALARLEDYIWNLGALWRYVGTTDWSVGGKCSDTSINQTTKLSPYLAFGCVSPRLVYWEALRFEKEDRCKGVRGLINSLLWRDFYRFIVHFAWGTRLFHLYGPTSCGSVPNGHTVPTKWCCKHYNNIFGGSDPRLWDWEKDSAKLRRWTDGRTGYPFVDASMLELAKTGYMHHLNRETVGWFFVRDLRLDWRLAAEWFESCLVDYDCVLNWGNWVYFILTQLPARMDDRPGGGPRYTLPRYSPYLMATQVLEWGSTHDPSASFVKKWLPQLLSFSPQRAREPWRRANSLAGEVDDEAFEIYEFLNSVSAEDACAAGWACEACTLENPLAHGVCGACGTRRPRLRGAVARLGVSCSADRQTDDIGIYEKPPIVPPPPDSEGEGSCVLGECAECALDAIGWAGDDGVFFCGKCWNGWAAVMAESETKEVGRHESLRPRNASGTGWSLVPLAALPQSTRANDHCRAANRSTDGSSSGCNNDISDVIVGEGAPGVGEDVAYMRNIASKKRPGTRWTVKGSRGGSLEHGTAG
eukprot:TRINITY_DN64133_c0_g1_i1.p1 TRINITY_DN64133_c0_g1~~TRINITY_DN64133_c0_g1_i1.p1  ORF type:complete len:873 (+),score=104.95 TRINITY_DN64133_c0_g1_i1:105-2723(+)